MPSRWNSWGTAIAVAALVAVVLAVVSRGFFSGDFGVKFAQAHALWESGFSSRALPYDWDFDPSGRFLPYGEFLREVDGEVQGIYSVVFAALCAPLIAAFGVWGTALVPAAGGVLVLLATRALLLRAGRPAPLALAGGVAAAAGTPILFYSGQFAEHAPAAGLCTLSLALLAGARAPGRAAAAGAVAGLAATLRPEAYCALVSLGLAALAGDGAFRARLARGAALAAAAAVVVAAYWGLNLALSDHWDPLVALNTDDSASLEGTRTMLVGEVDGNELAFWLLPFAAAAVVGLVPKRPLAGWGALAARAAVAGWIAYVALLALQEDVGRTQAGLFALTPLAAYGLMAGPYSPGLRGAWIFAVTFTAQVLALDSSGTAGGLQLGARLLLPAVPALVALAFAAGHDDSRLARGWPRRIPLTLPALALAVITAVAMARALPEANAIADKGHVAARAVAEAPGDVVVTGRWWESQVLASALSEGKVLYHARGSPRRIFGLLAEAGVERVVFVSGGRAEYDLPGDYVSRRAGGRSNWLEIQEVVLEPRE